MSHNHKISIVCPLFNEENMVLLLLEHLMHVLNNINMPFEIVCVNDGSTDRTLEKLLQAKSKYTMLRVIHLSRNFGKEAALTAGLDHAVGDVIIPIDADLQDPPELISSLIRQWQQGYDVVLAKRTDRTCDPLGKRLTAKLFYKLHNLISPIKIPDNVGDFRLISQKVNTAMKQLPENQRFMKGLFAWVGFKTAVVEYRRNPRKAGKSTFTEIKLWNLAVDGFTSFSTVPLRFWLYLGLVISGFAFVYASFIIIRTLILGIDVPGYASLLVTMLFLGGIQLMSIGVLGEYIGRIYMETKQRPTYIIDKEF